MTTSDRDNRGRFAKGNPGGPGNPNARHAAALRSTIREAVTPEDMAEVMRVLLDKAKAGELAAIRELFDRTIGKPTESELSERLDQLEARAAALLGHGAA